MNDRSKWLIANHMAWNKQFNVDAALTRAMEAFWAQGFEATSMQDLVSATGVNRASLYATYGDKRALFLACMRQYDRDVRRATLEKLRQSTDPAAAIAALFDRFIAQVEAPGRNWGCFLTNSALELAAHDREVADFVNAAQDDMKAFFLTMIRKGQESGQFDPESDAENMAHQTLASLLGLLVMIRSRPSTDYLEAVRNGALTALA